MRHVHDFGRFCVRVSGYFLIMPYRVLWQGFWTITMRHVHDLGRFCVRVSFIPVVCRTGWFVIRTVPVLFLYRQAFAAQKQLRCRLNCGVDLITVQAQSQCRSRQTQLPRRINRGAESISALNQCGKGSILCATEEEGVAGNGLAGCGT